VLELTGTPVEHHNIHKIGWEIPLSWGQDPLRQAQNKFECARGLSAASGRTGLRPMDSKGKHLGIQKSCDFNRLILFNFFNQLLVSPGAVWKYLTLTGTIWAQKG